MHWDAVGRALVALGGAWLAVAVLKAARAGERGAAGPPPETGEPGGRERPRRAWTAFVGPVLALAVGLGLSVLAVGGR